jgi:(p)ppGpp synthase/HD superfamily hydrolase
MCQQSLKNVHTSFQTDTQTPESSDPDNKPPWHQRKQAYLQHLRTASPDVVLVSVADKLHNIRAIVTDSRQIGDRVWLRFNREASKEDQLRFYRQLIEILRQIAVPTAIVHEMDKLLKELDGRVVQE